ncbi:alpha/beta fold hydrolase [Kineococcus sp. T13]|uniref:alpha/beta fold hydrolase n=1 Tax=Kineococcus vitellinus TaxID=2696565 RepID=UPI00141320BC|nr:alpha/beta hydrolase [Kineococcus vitellinus]NAZ74287.1 alpha/beta fold hydrolase [Kineococcus vitellinus]
MRPDAGREVTFSAHDGTRLAYRLVGHGAPLVCLPGGPMQDSSYLGGLGGLSAHRQLVLLDLRGTGRSATPQDVTSCRCDRLVDDVDALRAHLRLDRVDLLAHCAGANLAVLYAQHHPERVGKLALITPSVAAVGVPVTGQDRLAVARLRRDEPWFTATFTALEAVVAGRADAAAFEAIAPFWYGRWDERAQALHAAQQVQRNREAAGIFGAGGAFDPPATRAAMTAFTSPVLLLAGEVDVNSPPEAMARLAGLFPRCELVIQAAAGHFPWLDDAEQFLSLTTPYLR